MTTIEIIKKAKVDSVDKDQKSITVTGIDSITGRPRRRTFGGILPSVLDKAESLVGRGESPVVVEVDSGTKNIDLRDDGKGAFLEGRVPPRQALEV